MNTFVTIVIVVVSLIVMGLAVWIVKRSRSPWTRTPPSGSPPLMSTIGELGSFLGRAAAAAIGTASAAGAPLAAGASGPNGAGEMAQLS